MANLVSEAERKRRTAELTRAFELLEDVVDLRMADELWPAAPQAVLTTSVVLWLLVLQRMQPDLTLETAIKALLQTRPALGSARRQARQQKLSDNSGAYSRARGRLDVAAAQWLAEEVAKSLMDRAEFSFAGRPVFLIDGTTITLAPEPSLRRKFPPARNQHGAGVWPVVQLVVCHELGSGAALIPEVGAMYGPEAISETALISEHLSRLPAEAIVLADAGYGIFSVAWQVAQSGRDFLIRLSAQRGNALRRKATLVSQTATTKTYRARWYPQGREQKRHGYPPQAALDVWLHQIVIHETLTLELVTTRPETAAELAQLYGRRGEVETDLRNLKVVLQLEVSRVRSVEMFRKELLASIVAYNLVAQFRQQAAALAQLPAKRLSFKRVWSGFRIFLLQSRHAEPDDWQAAYDRALYHASREKLPNRPGRSYPRQTYSRRPKAHHTQTRRPPQPSQCKCHWALAAGNT